MLGKYSLNNFELLENNKDILLLTLDPADILIPSKYNSNKPDCGFDICFIGLSRSNRLIVNEYLMHKFN